MQNDPSNHQDMELRVFQHEYPEHPLNQSLSRFLLPSLSCAMVEFRLCLLDLPSRLLFAPASPPAMKRWVFHCQPQPSPSVTRVTTVYDATPCIDIPVEVASYCSTVAEQAVKHRNSLVATFRSSTTTPKPCVSSHVGCRPDIQPNKRHLAHERQ